MKRLNVIWIFALILGLSISFVFAQYKMWVTSGRARLKVERKASSRTIATLPIGTEVRILTNEKRWYWISTPSGEKGWMYRGRLSKSPPSKEVQKETGGLFASMSGSEIRADEANTDRSIRGLSRETEEYARNRGTPAEHQKALDRVLALSVTEREIENFLREGKIGEYAP